MIQGKDPKTSHSSRDFLWANKQEFPGWRPKSAGPLLKSGVNHAELFNPDGCFKINGVIWCDFSTFWNKKRRRVEVRPCHLGSFRIFVVVSLTFKNNYVVDFVEEAMIGKNCCYFRKSSHMSPQEGYLLDGATEWVGGSGGHPRFLK